MNNFKTGNAKPEVESEFDIDRIINQGIEEMKLICPKLVEEYDNWCKEQQTTVGDIEIPVPEAPELSIRLTESETGSESISDSIKENSLGATQDPKEKVTDWMEKCNQSRDQSRDQVNQSHDQPSEPRGLLLQSDSSDVTQFNSNSKKNKKSKM